MEEDIKCSHDWRVNPYKIIPSFPTKVQLHCIKCHRTTSAPFHFNPKVSRRNDPTTWKKYTGEVDQ